MTVPASCELGVDQILELGRLQTELEGIEASLKSRREPHHEDDRWARQDFKDQQANRLRRIQDQLPFILREIPVYGSVTRDIRLPLAQGYAVSRAGIALHGSVSRFVNHLEERIRDL